MAQEKIITAEALTTLLDNQPDLVTVEVAGETFGIRIFGDTDEFLQLLDLAQQRADQTRKLPRGLCPNGGIEPDPKRHVFIKDPRIVQFAYLAAGGVLPEIPAEQWMMLTKRPRGGMVLMTLANKVIEENTEGALDAAKKDSTDSEATTEPSSPSASADSTATPPNSDGEGSAKHK